MHSLVQGSGIGPTLIIIFTIDFQPIDHSSHMTKCADDCSRLERDVYICLEFQRILKLAGDIKLSFNMSKTKEIAFRRQSQETIYHLLK